MRRKVTGGDRISWTIHDLRKSEWIIIHYIYLATVYSISISKYDNAYMWYYYSVRASES